MHCISMHLKGVSIARKCYNHKPQALESIQMGRHGSSPIAKSEVAKGFLTNTNTDPTRKAIGPLWSNCFPWEVHTDLCEMC